MKHVDLSEGQKTGEAVPSRELSPTDRLFYSEDRAEHLWRRAGYFAMIFCFWFAFVAPIVLFAVHWP
ncbi:MAG: hypothetical protein AAFY65_07870 [Pseudomonadota bacterium]